MDQASSKYVDQLAAEKLLNEKLRHVHHHPGPGYNPADYNFDDWNEFTVLPESVHETAHEKYTVITFPSAIPCEDKENNRVHCRCFAAAGNKGNVIFVHGLYEENLQIYHFFISLLREQGLNVYVMMLPYHYERKPSRSRFSGEFFWSADLDRNARALKQSVYDLTQLYRYIKHKNDRPLWICGFSMGGGIALTLVSVMAVDGIFCINPVCNIASLVWNSLLFSSIKEDLVASGIALSDIETRYRHFEPLNIGAIKIPGEKVVIATGLYDQINDPANYERLIAHWQINHSIRYKAGHLNILRVPKLARDVANYYFGKR